MVLRYTGLSGGWFMREGMLLIVPSNWRTADATGNVTADARSEILDALNRKGITIGSGRSFNHVFSEFHCIDGTSWLTYWEKA